MKNYGFKQESTMSPQFFYFQLKIHVYFLGMNWLPINIIVKCFKTDFIFKNKETDVINTCFKNDCLYFSVQPHPSLKDFID